MAERVDVLVIGAGFGGMATALELARSGLSVRLHEALGYPGGCAATFEKQGHSFEAGATLFSGFAEGQLFARWHRELELPVRVQLLDKPLELRTPGWSLPIWRDRARFREALAALPGAPVEAVKRFLSRQERVADALWPLFDEPRRLPPLTWDGLRHHAGKLGSYAALMPLLRRSLSSIMRADGLGDWQPAALWASAVSQITIQAAPDEAEAVFALGAMDYPHRGAVIVDGGIGALGRALCGAVEGLGGQVQMADRVRRLRRENGVWMVDTRHGVVEARAVVANVLPSALENMWEGAGVVMPHLQRGVRGGWGAVMLFLVVRDHEGLPEEGRHVQAVADGSAPLIEGNHLLCSLGPRVPGQATRTATVSTHVAMRRWFAAGAAGQGALTQRIQERMRDNLQQHVPEVADHIVQAFPGSPRTFARFTRRPHGMVGGIPRTRGLHHLRDLWPTKVGPRLWLVGDTTFPGQSTLSVSVGGCRTARAVAAALG